VSLSKAISIALLVLILGGVIVEIVIVKLGVDLDTSTKNTNVVLSGAQGTLGDIDTAAKSITGITVDEAPRLKKEFEETLKVTSGFSDLVRHTDINLNGKQGTLVLLNGNLNQISILIQDINKGIQLTNTQILLLQETITNTNKLIQDMDSQVTNPNVKALLASLAQAGDEAVASLTHLNNITVDGNKIADKYEYELTKPVKIWWTILEKILQIGAPVATAIR